MAMNMGYCRFENTLMALAECKEALEESGLESLSPKEKKSAQSLLCLCAELAADRLDEDC